MNIARVVFLLAIAGILILFTSFFVSAGTALKSKAALEENEAYRLESLDGLTDGCIKAQAVVKEIKLWLDDLSASLQRFEFRLVLLSERLHEPAKEYTFLQPAVDTTNQSIEIVDSVVADLKSDSNTLNDVNSTLGSLNEGIISLDQKITSSNEKVISLSSIVNTNLKDMENVSKIINSTFGEANITENITTDVNETAKEFSTFFK
jgi:methyl-accepting chemotaxis protein